MWTSNICYTGDIVYITIPTAFCRKSQLKSCLPGMDLTYPKDHCCGHKQNRLLRPACLQVAAYLRKYPSYFYASAKLRDSLRCGDQRSHVNPNSRFPLQNAGILWSTHHSQSAADHSVTDSETQTHTLSNSTVAVEPLIGLAPTLNSVFLLKIT